MSTNPRWSRLSIAAFMLLSSPTAACATYNTSSRNDDQRILRTTELRNLLRNVAVQQDYGSIQVSHPITEIYNEDGRYVRRSRGGGHEGTFEINDDRVCVQFMERSSSECFRFYVDSAGGSWKVPDINGEAMRVVITELRTLDTTELRALLRNASMRLVDDPAVHGGHPEVERYYENGEYTRVGGRATHSGTFTIEDSRVCIRLRRTGEPECYRLQRDAEGSLWKVGDPNHPPRLVRVLPMGIR